MKSCFLKYRLMLIIFFLGAILDFSAAYAKTDDERLKELIGLLLPLEQQRHHELTSWEHLSRLTHADLFTGTLEYHNETKSALGTMAKDKLTFHFYRALSQEEANSEYNWGNWDFDILLKRTNQKKYPVLVIFPPIHGSIPFEASIGGFLASMGISTLIAYPQEDFISGNFQLEELNSVVAKTTFGTIHLMDWLTEQKDVDSEKIALLGISLGGLRATMVMGLDQRPKAAILVVTGGNLPEILATSQQQRVIAFRERTMNREGIETPEEFYQKLQDYLFLDPLSFVRERTADDFFMLIAESDEAVPTKNQWLLWNELGKPKYRSLPFGHFFTAISSAFYFREFYEFLEMKWNGGRKMDGETRIRLEQSLKFYFPEKAR